MRMFNRKPYKSISPLLLLAVLLPAFADAGVTGGFWHGVNKEFSVSPNGNVAAISCHNCYVFSKPLSSENQQATVDKLEEAIAQDADLLELDIMYQNNQWVIAHDRGHCYSTSTCASLGEVLSDAGLNLESADQVMFIELKDWPDDVPNNAYEGLINNFLSSNLVSEGRPIVFRTFNEKRDHLTALQGILGQSQYDGVRKDILLSELFWNEKNSIALHQDLIKTASDSGFDMVEFNHRIKNVSSYIAYAKALGLGVNVGTFGVLGEMLIAGYRDKVDALTVDYSVLKSRQVVQDDNSVLFLDMAGQSYAGGLIRINNSKARYDLVGRYQTAQWNEPTIIFDDVGEDRFGATMQFRAGEAQNITLYDVDNKADEGWYLSLVANFDEVELGDGQTASLVAKTDSGGAGLEMHNPVGSASTVLRFAVNVNGAYHYANCSMSMFNATDSYHIMAGYDGDGHARVLVDGVEKCKSGYLNGGIKVNDAPWVIGADPQGTEGRRFFFSGKIQSVSIQTWGNH